MLTNWTPRRNGQISRNIQPVKIESGKNNLNRLIICSDIEVIIKKKKKKVQARQLHRSYKTYKEELISLFYSKYFKKYLFYKATITIIQKPGKNTKEN